MRTFLLNLCLCLASFSAAAGPVLDRIAQRGKLVVGYRDDSMPFSYLDATGKPIGYAIDLCMKVTQAVRRKLAVPNLPVEFVLVSSTTRIPAVAQGEIDLECESTTNNAERRKTVAFAVPHYVTGSRYIVRADSNIRELKDFQGKKLAATLGTTTLKVVEQVNKGNHLGIDVVTAPDLVRGVEMVEKGEADGYVLDEVLLVGIRSSRPDPSKLMIVGKFLTIEPLSIMLPKTDLEFKQIVDGEMKRLIVSQEAAAIHDRWFTRPIPPNGRSLNLPMNYLHKDFWKYPSDWVPD